MSENRVDASQDFAAKKMSCLWSIIAVYGVLLAILLLFKSVREVVLQFYLWINSGRKKNGPLFFILLSYLPGYFLYCLYYRCPNCNARVSLRSKFCKSCDAQLSGDARSAIQASQIDLNIRAKEYLQVVRDYKNWRTQFFLSIFTTLLISFVATPFLMHGLTLDSQLEALLLFLIPTTIFALVVVITMVMRSPIDKRLKSLHGCVFCNFAFPPSGGKNAQYGVQYIPDFCENCGADQRSYKQAIERAESIRLNVAESLKNGS